MAPIIARIRALHRVSASMFCVILLALGTLLACGPSDTTAFDSAQTDGSPAAFEKFIHDFPDSRLIPVAKTKLEDASYAEAREAGSVEAWKIFLEKYPNSKHSAEAKYEMENIAFQSAKKEHSKAAYAKFLADYPNGTFSQAAKSAIEQMEAAEAATPAPEDAKKKNK